MPLFARLAILLATIAMLASNSQAQDRPATAADPTLPTKVIPLYVKVGCLQRDYKPTVKSAKTEAEYVDAVMVNPPADWKYDFLSTSPTDFVKRLARHVNDTKSRMSATDENRGKFKVQCEIKLLIVEGHISSGLGGCVTTGKILSDEQIVEVQKLMSADATIFWVACTAMSKHGTTEVLQKILADKGGAFVGFKGECLADCSFPNQIGCDELYPAALKIPKGAKADDLKKLFDLCGRKVAADKIYDRDKRFPGSLDNPDSPYFMLTAEEMKKVKKPTIDELVGRPTIGAPH